MCKEEKKFGSPFDSQYGTCTMQTTGESDSQYGTIQTTGESNSQCGTIQTTGQYSESSCGNLVTIVKAENTDNDEEYDIPSVPTTDLHSTANDSIQIHNTCTGKCYFHDSYFDMTRQRAFHSIKTRAAHKDAHSDPPGSHRCLLAHLHSEGKLLSSHFVRRPSASPSTSPSTSLSVNIMLCPHLL